jgi:hypothetical protein
MTNKQKILKPIWISDADWDRAKPSEVFYNLPEHKKVLHVGGHVGREAELYSDVTFVEPLPQYAEHLRKCGYAVIEAAIGGCELFVTTYDQASSLLKPLTHKIKEKIIVQQTSIEEINYKKDHDLLVLDVQGSELTVLKSGSLDFEHIIVEVSNKSRYKNGTSWNEIVNYLSTNSKKFELIKSFQHGSHDIYDLIFKKV